MSRFAVVRLKIAWGLRCESKLTLLLSLATAMLCGPALAAPNQQHHRRGYSHYNAAASRQRQQQAIINTANQQIAAAKQVLAVAEAKGGVAQSKLDAALSKLKESSQSFHEAQSNTRHWAKELAEIEQELINEQNDDSAYAQAAKAAAAARENVKGVEERVTSESAAQLKLNGLTGSKLAEAKRSILELNPEYLAVHGKLKVAGEDLERVRRELFRGDAAWKETADALTEARKEEQEAEEKTLSGGSGRIGNTQTVKDAAEAAAAARIAIAQAEAKIRSVGGNSKSKSASNAPARKPAAKK